MLVSTAPPDSLAEKQIYQRWVQGHLVDGLVLSRMRLHDWRADYLCQNNFPFAAHGRTLNCEDYPYIEMDSRSGFELLVQPPGRARAPADRVYRRAADFYIAGRPVRGLLRAAWLPAGIDFDAALVSEGDLSRNGGYQAALQLLGSGQPAHGDYWRQ